MSVRRLLMISTVPEAVKKEFRLAGVPVCGEERLWRERAARMTLDALGHTNLTAKPVRHNDAVLYARRWFRQLFLHHPDPRAVDDAFATFEYADVRFEKIRDVVLGESPILFEIAETDSEEDEREDDGPDETI